MATRPPPGQVLLGLLNLFEQSEYSDVDDLFFAHCELLLVGKDHRKLSVVTTGWQSLKRRSWDTGLIDLEPYSPAAYMTRCVVLVKADTTCTASEREDLAARYADAAVAALSESSALKLASVFRRRNGIGSAVHRPLRSHPGYQALLRKHPPSNTVLIHCAYDQLWTDPSAAIAEAAELIKRRGLDSDEWYDLACTYAIASDKLPARRDELAVRAVELLGKAVSDGYRNDEHATEDADFDPIRHRPDFQAVLARMVPELAPPPRRVGQ